MGDVGGTDIIALSQKIAQLSDEQKEIIETTIDCFENCQQSLLLPFAAPE